MRTLLFSLILSIAAFGQSASYPGAVATDATMFRVQNNITTTVAQSQASSDTLLQVASSAGMVAPMLVSVGGTRPEIEAVCSINGNTLTIGYNGACPSITGRGFDGTLAAAHSRNTAVAGNNVAWLTNKMRMEIEAVQSALGPNMSNVGQGAPGVGVPAGGTVGQSLVKVDSGDYHTQWSTITGGGGGGTVTQATIAGTARKVAVGGTCTITSTGTCSLTLPSDLLLPLASSFTASGGTGPSFNLPSGIAPLGPVSGDFWNLSGVVQYNDGVANQSLATLGRNETFSGNKTFGGTLDASAATRTAPFKVGTTLPGTCTQGDLFFKSDSTPGQAMYQCDSTNHWSQQLNSGGSPGSAPYTTPLFTSQTTVTVLESAHGFNSPALLIGCQDNSVPRIAVRCGWSVHPTTHTVTVGFDTPQTGYVVVNGGIGPQGTAGANGITGNDGAPGSAGSPGLSYGPATSTTSLVTAGAGSKTFTTQANLAYTSGARIRATSVGTAEYMEGLVTSYSGTTLVVAMQRNSGTGTHADWNLNPVGDVGASGTGSGDVLGPSTNTNNSVPQWNGANSKILKDGIPVAQIVQTTQPNNYIPGMKQAYASSSTTPMWNLGTLTADPSGHTTGDFWYRSDTFLLSYDWSGIIGRFPFFTGAPKTTGNCAQWLAGGEMGQAATPCGAGAGDVLADTLTTATAIPKIGTSAKHLTESGITIDSSNNLFVPGTITQGSACPSCAGFSQFGQGTAPSTGTTAVTIYGAPSITSYLMRLPSVAATGVYFGTNSAGDVVMSQLAVEGNGSKVQLFTGADPATNDCAKFDVNHNVVGAGAPCGSGSGIANPASIVTPASGATPAFTCPSVSAGTVTVFAVPVLSGSGITSSTTSGCTPGQTVKFIFTQSVGGGLPVSMPSGWGPAPISPISGATTVLSYTVDGTGSGHLDNSSDDAASALFMIERAAPGTPAAARTYCWPDQGTHVLSCKSNNSATVSSMVVPNAGAAHQFATAISSGGVVSLAAIGATDLPPAAIPTPGTSFTMAAPAGVGICTGTCTVTMPVPAAGYQFCVRNDTAVATAITLSALGSSARYEFADHSAYGTAGTGTFVASAAAGNSVCLIGRDATHYQVWGTPIGTWTAN